VATRSNARVKIGLFDHIDRTDDRPLAQQYDERLAFIAKADDAGFYCYHLAEHHASPVSTAPNPGLFLSVVARATKQIHIGPLMYLLPFQSPLRIIEDICILDHLSHGRLEVGIGRGTSAIEMNWHGIDHEQAHAKFLDTYACIIEGLTHDRLNYESEYSSYKDVPMVLAPLQDPYPDFWYGSSSVETSAWAGSHGMHLVTYGSRAKANIAAYSAALAERGGPRRQHPAFKGGTAISAMLEIVVADTDEEARRIARPAHDHLYANQTFLRREHAAGRTGGFQYVTAPTKRVGDFDGAIAEGSLVVGSPESVTARLTEMVREFGYTYLIGYFMFGSMSLADASRSLDLFSTEVMPKLAPL
jgi:alkanesulfonate monooxygenase SsuD/methylene tetrahydromethanopterin reductase-like flavin-dependent oxidoreductase (luciferase family)